MGTVGVVGVGLAPGRADRSRGQDQDPGQGSLDQGPAQGLGLDPGPSLDLDPNRVRGPNPALNLVPDVQSRGQNLDPGGHGQGPEDQAQPSQGHIDQGLGREVQDQAQEVQQGLRQAPGGRVLAPRYKTRLRPPQEWTQTTTNQLLD